jgi:hypothetical protein
LVDPVFTTKNIDKCATTWWLRQVAEYWLNQGENRRVYFTVGKNGEYDTASITDKRIIKIPIDRTVDRYREMWLPPDEHMLMFNGWTGLYGDWDILLTTRNNGFYWRRIIGPPFKGSRFLVLAEPFPFLPFKKTFSSGSEGSFDYRKDCLHTIGSYLMFDKVHINTEYEKTEIFNTSKSFFVPSEQRILRANMDVTYPKNVLDENYVFTKEAEKNFVNRNPMMVVYPQRIDESERQFSKVFKSLSMMYAKLCSSGLNMKMQICTNSRIELPEGMRDDQEFLTVDRPPREEFWRIIKNCSVFLSFAIEEGLPFSLVECVKLGTIGVVNREKWSEDLFGKDYPWLVNNVPEAYAMVKKIYQKPRESWDRFVDWYKNYFKPVILKRGDSAPLFERETQAHFSQMEEELKKVPSEELIDTIEKECKKSVDLLSLPNTTAFRQGGNMRDRNIHKNGIYFKMPRRWVVSYVLRQRGWTITDDPWVLERGKK